MLPTSAMYGVEAPWVATKHGCGGVVMAPLRERASPVGSDQQPSGARAGRRVGQPCRPPASALAPCRCLSHAADWPVFLCVPAGLLTGRTALARVPTYIYRN